MGLYNTYGNRGTQLKVGDCEMKHYELGDIVDIPDGCYVGHEGVVVICGNTLLAEFPDITDKWGGTITPREIIEERNPICQAIKEVEEKHGHPG